MEPNDMARVYAEAAKNLSRNWLEGGSAIFAANRHLADAVRLWSDETRAAAAEVLKRAVQRSGEEMLAVFDSGLGEALFPARFGDMARAQAFLWTAAGLSAGERLGRVTPVGGEALPGFGELAASMPSTRTFVLGVVAMDLWQGYVTLRERARWMPSLVRSEDWELQHRRGAGRVLDAAKALGGTLIKAAQFASSRSDLLPAPYIESLSELQDRVPPQPWSVIEGAVAREIGRPVREAFEEFDLEPIASASIAQVHRARLADGRQVAVKVQYPRIRNLIEMDLATLESIFGAISCLEPSVGLWPILSYLRWTLPMELDFRREAEVIGDLREALAHRKDAVVPEVIKGLNTERLLVMEFMEGIKITDRRGLVNAGIEPERVAGLLTNVYAEQLFERGVFHADPHPGNLFVQPGPEGPVLVLLDHGLTVSVPDELVAAMREAIEALQEGDFEALAGALQRAGLDLSPDLDLQILLGLVGVLLGGDSGEAANGEETNLGQFGIRLGASVRHIPNDLLLVGRAIGLVDGITRQLHSDLDTIKIVAQHAQDA